MFNYVFRINSRRTELLALWYKLVSVVEVSSGRSVVIHGLGICREKKKTNVTAKPITSAS